MGSDDHCVYGGCVQGPCRDGRGHSVQEWGWEGSRVPVERRDSQRYACLKDTRFLFAHSENHEYNGYA